MPGTRYRHILTALLLLVALILGASFAFAQSGPTGSQQLPVGLNTISYQGRVTVNGQPYNGTGYFKFAIVDSQGNYTWNSDIIVQAQGAAAPQLGAPQNPIQLPVNKGLFSVRLGAVPDMPPIPAQAVADPDAALRVWFSTNGQNFTQLPDRPFSAAPWALMADTLDGFDSSDFAPWNHDHWGQTWSGSGTGLKLQSSDGRALDASTASSTNDASAIRGVASSSNGKTYGVFGQNASTSDGAAGVFGWAQGNNGVVYGIKGRSDSQYGIGVYGFASDSVGVKGESDTWVGVYGVRGSQSQRAPLGGAGVYGDSADQPGVFGSSESAAGVFGAGSITGTMGLATENTGTTYGVYGRSNSDGGYGVFGQGANNGEGVRGESLAGKGVVGFSETGFGVQGKTSSGVGVYGIQGSSTSTPPLAGAGVWGESAEHPGVWGSSINAAGVAGVTTHDVGAAGLASGNDGVGVKGIAPITGTVGLATENTGITYGVYGRSYSDGGYGVFGQGADNGEGVRGESLAGKGVVGFSEKGVGVQGYGWFFGAAGKFENMTTVTPTVIIDNLNGSAGGPGLVVTGTTTIRAGLNAFDVDAGALTVINDSAPGIGVDGKGSIGVRGTSSAANGFGVSGFSSDSNGVGVYGFNRSGGLAGEFIAEMAEAATPDAHAVEIRNLGSGGSGPDGLAIVTPFAGDKPGSSVNYVTFFSGSNETAVGAIEGNGSGGVVYKSGGADFAELLPAASGLEPGDVVVIGPDGKLMRSSKANQTNVAGVYSTAPAFLGGMTADMEKMEGRDAAAGRDHAPVAVVGIVPVKVSAENGAIRPGDLLTASNTPGHAMKAEPVNVGGVEFYRPGTIIGKALESLDKGTGVIRVLITLH
ncbi:MAG: hypothetical protein D6775_12790 [Caldilineae bacterium]|nr:MAG: hypothetical protein D6775_12790 [Caldilineae bacterium]